jgi:formate hydrogenlyase subunit 3/multisubunit Na+/H+ antiporter MnhD subunit
MNLLLLFPILLPIGSGLLCLIIPGERIQKYVAFIAALLTSLGSFWILLCDQLRLRMEWLNYSFIQIDFDLVSGKFSNLIMLACSLFGLLITIFSFRQMQGKARLKEYYLYLLFTVGSANGVVLSNNLVILMFFWGMIAIMLYLLVEISGTIAEEAAQKCFIIVGISDFLMLLGIVIIWNIAGTLTISEITLPVKGALATLAFLLLMMGAITKAGAMPFHSWIPSAAEVAHTTVMAFLPGSLDKLLGIYLLIRVSFNLFIIDYNMKILLMIIGAVTLIGGVMMALIQKDLKKLLSFHAISQVGYMVLGIGTGTAIGIAGGLFHMLNNAIYKCCLFLCAGSVEYRTKTTHLDQLGGLARSMPVTFITFAIAAFSISGIPPLNGFVSKWMVYQGIINTGGSVWPFFLLAALFGSALTLASFVKILHSIFLSQKPADIGETREVHFSMKFPMVTLAFFCLIFGVFAQFPFKFLIGPVTGTGGGNILGAIGISGLWSPTLSTFLLILSLICGFFIYRMGNIKLVKEKDRFVGGEPIDEEEIRIPGTHFYKTIESVSLLKMIYKKATEQAFDLYECGRKWIGPFSNMIYTRVDRLIDRFYDQVRIITLRFSYCLRQAHTGILTTYMLWVLAGIIIILFMLMR